MCSPELLCKVGTEQFEQGWGLVDQRVDNESRVIEANQAGGGEFPRCHLGPTQLVGDVGHHRGAEVFLFVLRTRRGGGGGEDGMTVGVDKTCIGLGIPCL